MKRYVYVPIMLIVCAVFFFAPPLSFNRTQTEEAPKKGELLRPQSNVAIITVDLSQAAMVFTNPKDIAQLRLLQNDFIALAGVKKVESILSASRVISELDDIVVQKAIPIQEADVTEEYLTKLVTEIPDFPELAPYINNTFDTLLFYIYYADKTQSIRIHSGLEETQAAWKDKIPFEYTGQAPIIAVTESLLTKDIIVFFPLLAIMVLAIFSIFKNIKVILVSLLLIVLSTISAFGFVRFLGMPNSPLVMLIPVFSLGLLSDYMIHYFYHRLYTPRPQGQRSLRRLLMFPLSLTALSTVTGFLSLSLINGSGHTQLGIIIAAAVIFTWIGVFYWLDMDEYPSNQEHPLKSFQKVQTKFFTIIAKHRYFYFAAILVAMIWGGFQLFNLSIEPYPIEQLPESTTIKKADTIINEKFYGTLPFFLEFDTGEKSGLLKKESLIAIENIQAHMAKETQGFSFSVLTVLKRINYYFMGSEESLLESTEFDDFYDSLIEQYLLYYSSSVDPQEYEAMLDNSYRLFSIRGLVPYRNYKDLDSFILMIKNIEQQMPQNWSLKVHGMAKYLETEQKNLRNNWVLSFISGSLLIFITVLLFYRKFSLAFLSLIPGVISMVISFGVISAAGISIDAFSIIFVAIITGLVIDYSIHTLVALDQIKTLNSLEEGFNVIMGYSGIPIFLSFLTSLLSFAVLLLSSFKGARSLSFLLLISLVLSFFLSLYLIPLLVLPFRLKKKEQ